MLKFISKLTKKNERKKEWKGSGHTVLQRITRQLQMFSSSAPVLFDGSLLSSVRGYSATYWHIINSVNTKTLLTEKVTVAAHDISSE